MGNELDLVLNCVARERRSDSEPRWSGGEGELWQEIATAEVRGWPEGFWETMG